MTKDICRGGVEFNDESQTTCDVVDCQTISYDKLCRGGFDLHKICRAGAVVYQLVIIDPPAGCIFNEVGFSFDPINATHGTFVHNQGAPMTLTVTGLPPLATFTDNGNGTYTLGGTYESISTVSNYVVTADDGNGTTGICVGSILESVLPPPIVSCPPNQSVDTGTSVGTLSSTNSGGLEDSWSISPALLAGLSFNTSNGDVTGTPTSAGSATYTITATNTSGSGSCTFNIGVTTPLAVPNISCPANQSLPDGVAMSSVSASNSGGASSSWSIAPGLPAGLSFNTSNGTVSGTPSSVTGNATYMITATNISGSDSCTFDIEVTAGGGGLLVPNISCPANQLLTISTVMTPAPVSNSGGAVASWSIAPALPTGLSFFGGILSGNPNVPSSGTYTVTATNATGSDTCSFDIDVVASLPAPIISCPANQTLASGTPV